VLGAFLHRATWLADRVVHALQVGRSGAKAAEQVRQIEGSFASARRGVIGLTKVADPAARDKIAAALYTLEREQEREVARLSHRKTADKFDQHVKATERLEDIRWTAYMYRRGENGIEVLGQVIDEALLGKLKGGRAKLKTGPETLAERLEADAESVCVAGFLDMLHGVFSPKFTAAMLANTDEGHALKRRVKSELEAFWACVTGSPSSDEDGNSALMKRFDEMVTATRVRYKEADQAISKIIRQEGEDGLPLIAEALLGATTSKASGRIADQAVEVLRDAQISEPPPLVPLVEGPQGRPEHD
jgi:hypothetical protein